MVWYVSASKRAIIHDVNGFANDQILVVILR